MATQYAVARCRNCGTVRPLIRFMDHYETVCTECGHVYAVRDADIKWVDEQKWPLLSALIGTRLTAFVTREAAETFDQGTAWG